MGPTIYGAAWFLSSIIWVPYPHAFRRCEYFFFKKYLLPGFNDQPLRRVHKNDICKDFHILGPEEAFDIFRSLRIDKHSSLLDVGIAIKNKRVYNLIMEILLCEFIISYRNAILL